jgi:poly-gamma-glutamate capsule biosynthesis protein CapA/YwtB (metallophosphatase superfamily)
VGEARPAPAVTELTIAVSGDLLIHTPVSARARELGRGRYDFRPLFARIRPIVRGVALALCHVEIPMGAGSPSPYPRLNAPAELAEAIAWTGWDACDTASNHTLDKSQAGVESTLRALDAAGVRHTGSARSPAEARRILLLDVRGLRVALLAYTDSTNGLPLPHAWSVNLLDRERVERDARRARSLGADLVLANFHWGAEYAHRPARGQIALADDLLRRRVVDAIVGQGPHVVQPIRMHHGRFAVYSEANLISNQTTACCPAAAQDGLVALLRVRDSAGRARVTRVDYVPIRVEHPGLVVQPVGPRVRELVEAGQSGSRVAAEFRASYERTVSVVGRWRRIRPLPERLP